MEEYMVYANMAEKLVLSNVNQAYLCYENALFLCSCEERRAVLAGRLKELAGLENFNVRKVSIAIVSYNSCYLMQKCIESIRKECIPGSYEILVVDNASTDGVREWLCDQEDVKTILLEENVGFPMGCNIAAQYAEPDYDFFLLNNDTRLTHNSLFWLRMGLYSAEDIGAVGSYANYAGNRQQLDVEFSLPGEYLDYAREINVPVADPYEERVRLSGFAMLIRRQLWDITGGMDESFSPGYFEDDDLSMRILLQGYRLLVCRNSFIYHAGSQSFAVREDIEQLLLSHMELFINKYDFNILDYAYPDGKLQGRIPLRKDAEFNVCHIGCGLGAELKLLRNCFPNANLVGVEKNEALFSVVSKTEMVFDSIYNMCELLNKGIFHILIISESEYKCLNENEINLLRSIGREDGIVLLI